MPGYKIPPKPDPKNLFKPGQSGNPGGRIKGVRSISEWYRFFGDMDPKLWPKESESISANARIALARIKKSMTSDGERSTEIIQDRTEGSVAQTLRTPDLVPPQTAEEWAALNAKIDIVRRNLGLDKPT